MRIRLKRYYCRWLLPCAATVAALVIAGHLHLIHSLRLDVAHRLAPLLFVAAVVLAVAVPVFLRASFAHRVRTLRRVSGEDFYLLQRRQIGTALTATYLIPVACLVELPAFYQAGIVLAALYAAYYQFPSARRIAFDRRIFRVDHAVEG